MISCQKDALLLNYPLKARISSKRLPLLFIKAERDARSASLFERSSKKRSFIHIYQVFLARGYVPMYVCNYVFQNFLFVFPRKVLNLEIWNFAQTFTPTFFNASSKMGCERSETRRSELAMYQNDAIYIEKTITARDLKFGIHFHEGIF